MKWFCMAAYLCTALCSRSLMKVHLLVAGGLSPFLDMKLGFPNLSVAETCVRVKGQAIHPTPEGMGFLAADVTGSHHRSVQSVIGMQPQPLL